MMSSIELTHDCNWVLLAIKNGILQTINCQEKKEYSIERVTHTTLEILTECQPKEVH